MTAGERRTIAVACAVAVVALMGLRVLPWSVRSLSDLRERAVERRRTLAETETRVRSLPALRDSVEVTLATLIRAAPRLLEGRTSAEAGASLQSLLAGRAAQSGMRIVRFDVSADSTGDVRRITARTELDGDVRGLALLLERLETGTPLLTVRALSIAAGDPTPHPGAAESLRVSIEVAGWFLFQEAS